MKNSTEHHQTDRDINRIIVWCLGAVVVLVTAGSFFLAAYEKEIPMALTSFGCIAAGILGGMLGGGKK